MPAAAVHDTQGAHAILPNPRGASPGDCYADVPGLPTIRVPHSCPACSQHAPNKHLLGSVARESLAIMTGDFWVPGAPPPVQ